MSHYETEDECDVAHGICDALRLTHGKQSGAEWLGWEIVDVELGEIEITTPDGKRYRATVEAIEEPDR